MKHNPNKGTARGRKAIRRLADDLRRWRSILVDRDGEMIAGHHTADAATQASLKRRVVKTDGREFDL